MAMGKRLKVPGAAAQGSAHAGAAGASGTAATGQQASQEGTMKMATDIGTEEALAILQSHAAKDASFLSTLLALNGKRTADDSQTTDRMTQYGDITQRATLHNLATQALQNAIETANMVAKQAVRHSDIAIDRQWNVNETDYAAAEILRSNTFKDAISGAVAAAVAAAVSAKPNA